MGFPGSRSGKVSSGRRKGRTPPGTRGHDRPEQRKYGFETPHAEGGEAKGIDETLPRDTPVAASRGTLKK